MNREQRTLRKQDSTKLVTLYMAIELSHTATSLEDNT